MIDASNGRGSSTDELPHEVDAANGDAPASRQPESGESHDRTASEAAAQPPSTPVSIRKIEANRRNAEHSTGPKTEAGKRASRLNAVTHGLLARVVVITAGDYREDPEEFAHLLEDLRLEFAPEGRAEDLEVQKIAVCYWRKMRAMRYEQGAIRKRTGDIREREERGRQTEFDATPDGDASLEESSIGIGYLVENLEKVKRLLQNGELSPEGRKWLEENFPDDFPASDDAQGAEETEEDGPEGAEADERLMLEWIEEQLRRLSRLREEVAVAEELKLESKISAAALAATGAVDKLIRYETSNDRELDRTLKRLEGMQARRRERGRAPTEA